MNAFILVCPLKAAVYFAQQDKENAESGELMADLREIWGDYGAIMERKWRKARFFLDI